MSAATIFFVALGLHALGLLAAASFGRQSVLTPDDVNTVGALFAFAIVLTLAGFALMAAA